MLASRIAWYSGVSGASCPLPQALVWSCDGWPGSPGTENRDHWPRQSGYFFSSAPCAAPIVSAAAKAITIAAVQLRTDMIASLALRIVWLITMHFASMKKGYIDSRSRERRSGSDPTTIHQCMDATAGA